MAFYLASFQHQLGARGLQQSCRGAGGFWLAQAFTTTSTTPPPVRNHGKKHGLPKKATTTTRVLLSNNNNNNINNNNINNNSNQQLKKKTASAKAPLLHRADRVLANRTGKSRSECFELLQQKRIWQTAATDEGVSTTTAISTMTTEDAQQQPPPPFKVVVPGPSTKILPNADLWMDKIHVIPKPAPLLMVYHKPKWVLSVRSDPLQRPCLDDSIVPTNMHPVGRLDYDTSGLLLFSSSGALTQHLLHPKHQVEKEYEAVVVGSVNAEALAAQLKEGVMTGEGIHTATLLNVHHFVDVSSSSDSSSTNTVQDYLQGIISELPPEYNQTDLKLRGYMDLLDPTKVEHLSTVRLTVMEGKHRMVRRILANCGHAVIDLQRHRFGAICLNDLPVGELRELTPDELHWAEQLLSLQEKQNKPKEKYIQKKQSKDSSSDDRNHNNNKSNTTSTTGTGMTKDEIYRSKRRQARMSTR